LSDLIDDALLAGELVTGGFLRGPQVRRLVADQRSGRRDMSKQIWSLLSLELWYRNARNAGIKAP
jgi:asparagine synthase (glutamine-hydrolysing)